MTSMLMLNSCAAFTPLIKSKKYPLPNDGIRVVKDKIYHNDILFAELRYYMGSLEDGERGLAIYYYPPYDKEVWIHPEGGWTLVKGKFANNEVKQERKAYTKIEDMNRVRKKFEQEDLAFTKGEGPATEYWVDGHLNKGNTNEWSAIFARSKVIIISPDGRYVYYKTQGLFGMSWFNKKYLVEYGE